MRLPDVNVLVAAFRLDHPHHAVARRWLRGALEDGEQVGLSSAVMTAVVRVLTNRRIWQRPDSVETALGHIQTLRLNASVIDVMPGPRHWDHFAELCQAAGVAGNLVSDAAHAAVAIEHGATWVSFDSDFARFPGLRLELLRAASDG